MRDILRKIFEFFFIFSLVYLISLYIEIRSKTRFWTKNLYNVYRKMIGE